MTKAKCLAYAAMVGLWAGAAQAEVTVLGWPGGPEETALRAVAEIYNARPETTEENKIDLLFTSRDGFFDKLAVDLAAGTQDFDLNLIATYSIGRYAPHMEPVSLSDEADAVFGETVLSTMKFDGQQYGVPTDLSLHFLYYRQDLIDALLSDDAARERYGDISEQHLGERLEPTDPDSWTWRDFVANALYFSQSVNPDSPTRYGTVIQMKNLLFNMMVFHSWPRSYGADWMDEAGNITVDSPAYREALEMAQMLYELGATPADSTSYEYAEANAAWSSGQVAAMVQWNAAAAELTEAQPATSTTAPPAGPEGRFTHIHGLGLGLNASTDNREGAQAFLEWLSTGE
ncbi:MAG: extracellular solute-binding protein, partial [Pseudomonadota bacterium]